MPRPNRDLVYLSRLRDWFAERGVMPSYSELGGILGFTTKNAAYQLARRLAGAGYVERSQGGRLKPGRRFFEIPVVAEKVRAGAGEALVPEFAHDVAQLEGLLVTAPSSTVLIEVKGDSMRDVGVFAGDYAVVERGTGSQSGDFVVAVVDGSFTLKELRYRGGYPVLVPHNPKYDVIEVKESLEIMGVVRGIVRRYPRRKSEKKGAAQ